MKVEKVYPEVLSKVDLNDERNRFVSDEFRRSTKFIRWNAEEERRRIEETVGMFANRSIDRPNYIVQETINHSTTKGASRAKPFDRHDAFSVFICLPAIVVERPTLTIDFQKCFPIELNLRQGEENSSVAKTIHHGGLPRDNSFFHQGGPKRERNKIRVN